MAVLLIDRVVRAMRSSQSVNPIEMIHSLPSDPTMNTVTEIQARLEHTFAPCRVVVTDNSAAHVGHAGSKQGGGHFHVQITSAALRGLTMLEQHRAIYAALASLMKTQIHALSIDCRLPSSPLAEDDVPTGVS